MEIADFAIRDPTAHAFYILESTQSYNSTLTELGLTGSLEIYNEPPITTFIGPDFRARRDLMKAHARVSARARSTQTVPRQQR